MKTLFRARNENPIKIAGNAGRCRLILPFVDQPTLMLQAWTLPACTVATINNNCNHVNHAKIVLVVKSLTCRLYSIYVSIDSFIFVGIFFVLPWNIVAESSSDSLTLPGFRHQETMPQIYKKKKKHSLLDLASTRLGLDLSADHVLRERTVRHQPGFLDGFSKVSFQGRLECVHQRISHDREHLRLDTITHVLGSKLGHDLGQQFDIGTQHVQGRVEHLNKVRCVHDETLAR
jgi:hypothetical protein